MPRLSIAPLLTAATLCLAASALMAAPEPVDVFAHGARGDASTDDTAALNRAFREAARTGRPVVLPAASFAYEGVLRIDGITVLGQGGGTVLLARNPAAAALRLEGEAPTLRGLTIASSGEVKAAKRTAASRVVIAGAADARISDCRITGGADAGIHVDGARGFSLSGNRISGTLGAGIHITGGAFGGEVSGNHILDTGGDGIAIVSFQDDEGPCRDLRVAGNLIGGGRGNGMRVLGGTAITLSGNHIHAPGLAGIIAGYDGNLATRRLHGLIARGNYLRETGADIGDVVASLRLTGSALYPLEDAQITGNTFEQCRFRGLELAGVVRNIAIERNAFLDVGDYGLYAEGENIRDVFVHGNRFVRIQAGAIRMQPGDEGVFDIADNFFRDINLLGRSWEDVIHLFEASGDEFIVRVRDNVHVNFEQDEVIQFFLESADPLIVPEVRGNLTDRENQIGPL